MSDVGEGDGYFDDRTYKACPVCLGIYRYGSQSWRGFFGQDRDREPYFDHEIGCEARIVPTAKMLELYESESAVRAEVQRLS